MCVQSSYWLATKKRPQAAIFLIKTTTITTIKTTTTLKITATKNINYKGRVFSLVKTRTKISTTKKGKITIKTSQIHIQN